LIEIFVAGGLCLILGFMVSWFTNVDFRTLGWFMLALPFIVIFVAGLSNITTVSPPTLNLVASETIGSITSHFVEYLLYSLGGYGVNP
jgi:hypothetical protein